jgi:hypothetical protein
MVQMPVTVPLVTTKEVKLAKKMTVGFNSAFTAESVALPKFQSQYGMGRKAYDAVETPVGTSL